MVERSKEEQEGLRSSWILESGAERGELWGSSGVSVETGCVLTKKRKLGPKGMES